MIELECLRCGHKWFKRKLEDPVACPDCKSPYWNKPRQRKIEQRAKAKHKSDI